jgi:hypothetical protein
MTTATDRRPSSCGPVTAAEWAAHGYVLLPGNLVRALRPAYAYDSVLPGASLNGPLFGPAAIAAANMKPAKPDSARSAPQMSEHARGLVLRMGNEIPDWRELKLNPTLVYVPSGWRLAHGQKDEPSAAPATDAAPARSMDKRGPSTTSNRRWIWRGLSPHLVEGPPPSVRELFPQMPYRS